LKAIRQPIVSWYRNPARELLVPCAMPNVDLNRSYSNEAQLAVYDAAHEFHLVVVRWLAETCARRSLVAPLERTTRAAAAALFVARHSASHERHVRRAKEEMLMCLAQFRLLTDRGLFSPEIGGRAKVRIIQILAGIDQLSVTPMDQWLSLKLPPPVPSTDPRTFASERRALDAKVEAAADIRRLFPQAIKASVNRRPQEASPPIEEPPKRGVGG
jgi:hypothetical protein